MRVKWPKRKVWAVILVGLGFGIALSWNVFTTSDLLSTGGQLKKLSIPNDRVSPVAESLEVTSVPVSVVRLDHAYKHKESNNSVPIVETLFRGDIPVRPQRPVDFPEQDLLGMSNGHQVLSEDEGTAIQMPFLVSPLKIPYKLVHLDLKGAPPKISFLKTFFKTIREAGANGILLEYEDMFPFDGPLRLATHKFHYTKEQLQDLITSAIDENLEVIPLVQTYGHLEFVLKLKEFRNLREVDAYPQEICPSNDKGWTMVTNLLDQVLSFKYSKTVSGRPTYIHIGCDEVYHIGECDRCKNKEPKQLFLNHVRRVANYIKKTYNVTPIIWDDMLRRYQVDDLVKSDIGAHVELMMWDYTEDVDRLLNPYLWPAYTQAFSNIWVASAYKGAFGEALHKVDIHRHALNQISWLRVLSRESPRIRNLRGVALTGWSRYDHFSVLCELLPVAIPSLILALQLWTLQDYEQATKSLFKLLKCDERSLSKLQRCHWNGVDLANSLNILDFYRTQTKSLIETQRSEKGWLNGYHLVHNYSSPWRLSEAITQSSQYLGTLKTYENGLRRILLKYFDDYVIDEWIEQKIEPIRISLEELHRDAKSLEARKVWERRPVNSKLIKSLTNSSKLKNVKVPVKKVRV